MVTPGRFSQTVVVVVVVVLALLLVLLAKQPSSPSNYDDYDGVGDDVASQTNSLPLK